MVTLKKLKLAQKSTYYVNINMPNYKKYSNYYRKILETNILVSPYLYIMNLVLISHVFNGVWHQINW